MAGTEDLREFIEERLLIYDPDMDISDGSPADVEIIDPIVRRYTPDPFETDIRSFIQTRLEQEYPDLDKEEGDVLMDLLVKPGEVLLDPIIREVEFLRKNKSLNDPDLLSPSEADSLMGNIFVSRSRGTLSVGQVRVYFNAPIAVSLSISNVASTATGLNFIPSSTQEISAEAMLFNQDGSLFYFDAFYQAEQEGTEYNIEAGEIISISNVQASVKITNLSRFRDGSPEESTLNFIGRGEDSVTERSLVIPRGTIARLFDQFQDLQHLQIVGFKDPEMERDVVTGGGLGPIVLYGTDGQTSDDGDGDGYATLVESPAGGFVANVGAIGPVEGYSITIAGEDYPIVEVVSDEIIRITASGGGIPDLADTLSGEQFYVRKNVITLSGIPGGIIGESINGEVEINDNEIHIGGCTDFHIRGTSLEDSTQTIEAVTDEDPITEGTGLRTKQATLPDDVVEDPTLLAANDFVAMEVQVGQTLVIETDAGNAGPYQIIKVAPGGNGQRLQVDPAPGSTVSDQKYKIVDTIDVNLNEPKTVRGSGTDLKTILGSTQVSTVAEVDFDQLGVEEGDVLRIGGNTLNAGDYTVVSISGTGNKLLTVDSQMRKTSSSETWQVYKAQEGMSPPVLRITSIDILDSSKQPTGNTIPYADPIDIRSTAFSNIGIGEKLEVTDARIGILGLTDLSGAIATINTKQLKVRINNGAVNTITFSGVVAVQDIIDQINAGISGFNVADIVEVNGVSRLSMRSRNNWIWIDRTGTANTDLGLSTSFDEDNRQVISSSISDWTSSLYGLVSERDSVYVLTGDNIEFWFLQEVVADRLLIVRVQDGKAVFPLTDESATVRLGSRSFGKVRCYFLEPTSFEVRGAYRRAALSETNHDPNVVLGVQSDEPPRAEFSFDVFGDESAFYRYFPDPALEHQLLAVTDGDVPDNLYIANIGDVYVESEKDPPLGPGQFSRDAEIDFLLREAQPGDILEVTYHPVQGTADIRAVGSGGTVDYALVPSKTLIFSLENGPDRTVTFSAQVSSPERVVSEINNQLGETVAYIEEDTGTNAKYLRLEADFSFILRSPGTAMALLGMTSVAGNNDAPAKGKYIISDVGYISGTTSNHMRMTIGSKVGDAGWTSFTAGEIGPSQHFTIVRPGLQRVSATDMQDNVEGSLYYADIELVSFGPGDEFNVGADERFLVQDHYSEGYRIANDDENLAFSTEEELSMTISRRVLLPGGTDSPENMTQISQQNLQINYERSPLVEQIQNFASSELDRVLVASILVRHLIPHFVRFELDYVGGSKVSVVRADIEDLLDSLLPDDELEATAVTELPRKRGATSVEAPLTLIGVVHNVDRTIEADRSQNAISTGRLATFIEDIITITRVQS